MSDLSVELKDVPSVLIGKLAPISTPDPTASRTPIVWKEAGCAGRAVSRCFEFTSQRMERQRDVLAATEAAATADAVAVDTVELADMSPKQGAYGSGPWAARRGSTRARARRVR